MAPAVWNDSMEIGISDVDQQHKGLVEVVAELEGALGFEGQEQVVLNTMYKMEMYTREHFAFEKGFMTAVGFPDLVEHRKEHQAFVQKILDYKESVAVGHVPTSDLASFLSSWLVDHIQGTDRDFGIFYSEQK